MQEKDRQYMRRALALAKLGQGSASPNPVVGCVIVHDGKIIGEGYHTEYGKAHAEVEAVRAVEDKSLLSESTVYVTLEPCSHFGKTPPCADMLVSHNVKRVVIARRDPFEQVAGAGIAKLEAAGIEVEVGLMAKEAYEGNRRFFTAVEEKRPYIILKWAQTADGFIARKNYDSKWISNPSSRQLTHKWRAEEDAIMVGTNTALMDKPSLTVRDWVGKHPLRVVIDKSGKLPADSPLLNDEAPTVIYNLVEDKELGPHRWVQLDKGNFLLDLLHNLKAKKVGSLFVEGGTQLHNAFIAAGLWDEMRVFTASHGFGEGIDAPRVAGTRIHQENLDGDDLSVYRRELG